MTSLIILNLFDNTSIINASITIDGVDKSASTTSGSYITRNTFDVVARQGDVIAYIQYVLDDTVWLNKASVSTRYNPTGNKVDTPLEDYHRTLADIDLKNVFESIDENKEYIQTWFDWLKKHQSVIDTTPITLSSTAHYEGLLK